MMNQKDQDSLVQKIRTQYTDKGHSPLDGLKKLDAKVKRPAHLFAYIFRYSRGNGPGGCDRCRRDADGDYQLPDL